MTDRRRPALPVLLLAALVSAGAARAQTLGLREQTAGTSFPYSGSLDEEGVPAAGRYDFDFELYDAPQGGTLLGAVTRLDVPVREGRFLVQLDFGAAVTEARDSWLEVRVRGAGSGPFTRLEPRRRLAALLGVCQVNQDLEVMGKISVFPPPAGGMIRLGTQEGIEVYDTFNGLSVFSPQINALDLQNPGAAGVRVANSGDAGLLVIDAGTSGVQVAFANQNGFQVDSAGLNGVQVNDAGFDGIQIQSAGRDGIRVSSAGALAGNFTGNVSVSGTLTKGGGSFLIDHPLDPRNRLLAHSFVESPDMMNIYNGNAVLDADGAAWVELPSYFEALNREVRYHLTPIGVFAPLYVAEEARDNRFRIAGGRPGMKVSWQVTGVRKDPYAELRRIEVERDKPPDQQGSYLHPEAYAVVMAAGALDSATRRGAPAGRRSSHAGGPPVSRLAQHSSSASIEFALNGIGGISHEDHGQTLRETREAVAQAIAEGDVERIFSFWTDDIVIYPVSEPAVRGIDAVREYVRRNRQELGLAPRTTPIEIVASESGDLGYIVGTYEWIDREGRATMPGRYVTLWRKNEQGEWKVFLEIHSPRPVETGA